MHIIKLYADIKKMKWSFTYYQIDKDPQIKQSLKGKHKENKTFGYMREMHSVIPQKTIIKLDKVI